MKHPLLEAVLALALVLAACSSDGGESTATTVDVDVDLSAQAVCSVLGDATRSGENGLYVQEQSTLAFWDAYASDGPPENREHAEVVWRTIAEADGVDNPSVAWGDGHYITAIGNLATWHTLNC